MAHKYAFLIKKYWHDSFENHLSSRCGYEDHIIIDSEEEAKKFCDCQGDINPKKIEPATNYTKKFIYKKVIIVNFANQIKT